jgi:hypothetical protein
VPVPAFKPQQYAAPEGFSPQAVKLPTDISVRGRATLSWAVPLTSSAVAVMTAEPSVLAVTRPEFDTLKTSGSLVDQLN